ncbi:MAG: 23S rRNA (uracil(1939)-C(5))-methyltransferase RlmD [Calditrichaeota bacterium]|nr:MAG: 23S rRNA (uracil(1939)-C(5))-methyltransferase RlmD [Calditrichota bacterium]
MAENFVYPVKKGHDYTVSIERLAFGGKGIARVDNYVLFVARALPGDVCRVRITKRKRQFGEARILEIESPSPMRRQAPCTYFDWCGGCTWQNMDYTHQLEQKTAIVREALRHPYDLGDVNVEDIIPADPHWGYRNKMEFSFADRKWLTPEDLSNPEISKDFALGLHVPGTFDKILDIDHCMLQSAEMNRVLNEVDNWSREKKLQPYGIRSHEGLLRFLVLRQSRSTGAIMVNIVTSRPAGEELMPLAEHLIRHIPQVAGVVNNVNARKAQIARGDQEILLAGQPVITDAIGPFEFEISANSFFQTNTLQAARLYETALAFAGLTGTETVWDLYCGAGTITLFLARKARKVVGFEIEESSIRDARANARRYDIRHVEWLAGDVRQHMARLQEQPDVLVTDPPRAGMHADVVQSILEARPRRIVYVSCNPATLARDLHLLKEKYTIRRVQPVDMFPQTYHIETVAQLDLTDHA